MASNPCWVAYGHFASPMGRGRTLSALLHGDGLGKPINCLIGFYLGQSKYQWGLIKGKGALGP